MLRRVADAAYRISLSLFGGLAFLAMAATGGQRIAAGATNHDVAIVCADAQTTPALRCRGSAFPGTSAFGSIAACVAGTSLRS